MKSKTLLISGTAGFIGASLVSKMLNFGFTIIGVDNQNKFYDCGLKELRLINLCNNPNYFHYKIDISNYDELSNIFKKYKPSVVVNLAGLAGVRYSVESPLAYVESNINGFINMIECSRTNKIDHFIYASSSSVYGANKQMPFSIDQPTQRPLNMYAATKIANEAMANSYSNVYKIKTTGLRLFTAYGPWGRPDMALFKFTRSILQGTPIQLYNNGEHFRDFTYIDDIVDGIHKIIESDTADPSHLSELFNIGNGSPVSLLDFVSQIELTLNKKAIKEFIPPQIGDMLETYADINPIKTRYGYEPKYDYKVGIKKFVQWYLKYADQIYAN